MAMRDFEVAQAEAMELLLQQCVESAAGDRQVSSVRSDAAHAATLMDLLAQSCEDASAMVQDMSYEDVAANLTRAIAATQQSLRSVRENVGEILDDPEKMRVLCQNLQSADHPPLLLFDADTRSAMPSPLSTSSSVSTELAVAPPDEENVRNMMAFAENMCGVLDDALSTITQDELALTAQLSLGIAQRVLEAGQALFVSLGDDEREKLRGDQAERITIEELPADDTAAVNAATKGGNNGDRDSMRRRAAHRARAKQQQRRLKHSAVLHTYLVHLATKTRAQASEHPFMTGALTVVSLPFVGFAVPVASLVGVALMVEKYYPEHASLTVEMFSNFVQMTKLWVLLVKISARQLGVVARECFKSWLEYASTHGFVATGKELASASISVGSLCVSRVYHSAVSYAHAAPPPPSSS